ncbi:MAG TPA: Hsp20/alpha crystallin family protein [Opitutales bacterium]|nr:Hsp20/alpha crystallin family protein [Opitutales bacterium]
MNTLLQNQSAQCTIRPSYESTERADAYEVRIRMPGVRKEGVSIALHGDELIVGGAKAPTPEGWRALRREIPDSNYALTLGLNVEIDGEKISAKVEDGVLTLTLPKAEKAKPRQISIE